METIRPLETEYDGITFRSRLEARWAVFMDELAIDYAYEDEAFDLGRGLFYLPDFWLPDFGFFVEVKPSTPTAQEDEKVARLAQRTGFRAYCFFGSPRDPWPAADLSAFVYYPSGDRDFSHWWCVCPTCGKLGVEYSGRADRIQCECHHEGRLNTADHPLILDAYRASRAARFFNPGGAA